MRAIRTAHRQSAAHLGCIGSGPLDGELQSCAERRVRCHQITITVPVWARTVSQNTGVRALLVHALHEQAKALHEHYGSQESPKHPMTLILRLNSGKA